MAKKRKDDWVQVKLTARGEQLAGEGTLRIVDRTNFEFTPGVAQQVTKAVDWALVLKNKFDGGEPLFELVDDRPEETAGE